MIIDLLKYVCNELEKKQIEYMLSGSLAMSIYATPRFTRDVDIVINLKKEDIEKFTEIFSGDFYLDKNTVAIEVERKGMFNIIDNKSGYKIDIIVKKISDFRDEEFQRKTYQNIFDMQAWVVSKEDLAISKLLWIQTLFSETQISDLRSLLKNPAIDKVYILKWCEKLNLKTYNLL